VLDHVRTVAHPRAGADLKSRTELMNVLIPEPPL
jgi:hypothetical protein